MLLAGNHRGDLQTLAAQNGTAAALARLLDTLESFEGVVWLCALRRPGGWIHTIEWQTRDADGHLVTVREAWLDTSAWEVSETPVSPRPRTPVSPPAALREACLDKVG